jgi:hypothetical protein
VTLGSARCSMACATAASRNGHTHTETHTYTHTHIHNNTHTHTHTHTHTRTHTRTAGPSVSTLSTPLRFRSRNLQNSNVANLFRDSPSHNGALREPQFLSLFTKEIEKMKPEFLNATVSEWPGLCSTAATRSYGCNKLKSRIFNSCVCTRIQTPLMPMMRMSTQTRTLVQFFFFSDHALPLLARFKFTS